MLEIFLFFLGFGGCLINAANMQVGGKEARLDRLTNCPGTQTPMTYAISGMRTIGNQIEINSTITAKEDINDEMTMTTKLQRCKSKESLDTCENFHTFTVKKFCESINTSDMWKAFYSGFKPKWQCPIKKGVYVAENTKFDATAFLLFPVDGWFYKVRSELKNVRNGRLMMCTITEAKVSYKN